LKYLWLSNKARCHLPRQTISQEIKCRLQPDRKYRPQPSARTPVVVSSPEARARPVQELRGRAEGTIYSLSANIAGQVSVYLNGQASGPFSLQLQSGDTLAASQAVLDLLLYAFENDRVVNVGYIIGNEIVEVQITKSP
jgi:hypothetical protein